MDETIKNGLERLSDSNLDKVIPSCESHEFDVSELKIPMNESLANIRNDRNVVWGLISKGQLRIIPLSIQSRIAEHLESIASHLEAIEAGTNEIASFVEDVEKFHAFVWQNRLFNLSDQFLGFENKMNSLKEIEAELNTVLPKLRSGDELHTALEALRKKFDDLVQSSELSKNEADKQLATITEVEKKALDTQLKIDLSAQSIAQTDNRATTTEAEIKNKLSEIATQEAKIRQFLGKVDEYRTTIETATENANTTVSKNDADSKAVIERVNGQLDNIDSLLEKATGKSLFETFKVRQDYLVKTKIYWRRATFTFVGLLVAFAAFLLYEIDKNDITVTFEYVLLRLAVAGPLIYGLYYSASQYSEERRLEEAYAFKSNISLSLESYRRLVKSMTDDEMSESQKEYRNFVMGLLNQVFKSPEPDSKTLKSEKDSSVEDALKVMEKSTSLVEKLANFFHKKV